MYDAISIAANKFHHSLVAMNYDQYKPCLCPPKSKVVNLIPPIVNSSDATTQKHPGYVYVI